MENLSAKDLQVFREKSRTFCGSFRIPLDKLEHEKRPDNPRQRDGKNVARLLDIFRAEDCQPREPENHDPLCPKIPAPAGSAVSSKSHNGSSQSPLYESCTEDTAWKRDASSSKGPTDDTTFYTIGRLFEKRKIARQADKKQAEVSPTAGGIAGDILRKPGRPYLVRRNLLVICGGSERPRLISSETKRNDQLQLDANTVAILQGRCPFRSTEDREFVRMRMLAGDILPAVKDDNRRSEIFDRICSVEHIILSIYMYIEDSKWLEPGVRILKELLPSKGKGSISQQFRALYNGQANMKVQTSEFTSEDRTWPSGNSFWPSYRQLFLFSLRHFPAIDGQAPRKDIAKQSSAHPAIQQRWWHELSSLAAGSGYRRLRRKYPDRKAADAKAIEDCVRSILPPKYYQIDPAQIGRIIQLNCHLISNIPYAERMRVVPELTSDYDGCGSDISDRCGRPFDQSFQADQESLFPDYIFSPYSRISNRYLTSFAIKRYFFLSFFGSEEDDLDREPRLETLRDGIARDEGGNGDRDAMGDRDTMGDRDPITSNQGIIAGIVNPDDEDIQMASHHLLTSGNLSDTNKENESQLQSSGPPPPMVIYGQQNQGGVVSLAEASQLLFRTPRDGLFTVLSPLADNTFRKHQADPLDENSMVTALGLPSDARFIARDKNKQLKMIPPFAILDAARSEQLQTVLMVKQPNFQALIHRLEDRMEVEPPENTVNPEEELDEIT